MKLESFIRKLEELSEEHGDDMEVLMADNMLVVDPIFSSGYQNKKSIVITDEE